MATYVVRPVAPGSYPAIILVHAVLGLMPVWQDVATEIASHGYVVSLGDMYHRQGYRLMFPNWPEQREAAFAASGATSYESWAEDSRAIIDYLKTLPDVDPERIGSLGHCYGGAAAFAMAAYNRDIRSVLMVCPSGMLNRPVTANYPVAPFELADRMEASVLCLSGSADVNPSPDDVREMADGMAARGKSFEWHVYEGEPPAGHAFFERDLPFYNAGAVAWAWPLKLDFLRRTLQEPPVLAASAS